MADRGRRYPHQHAQSPRGGIDQADVAEYLTPVRVQEQYQQQARLNAGFQPATEFRQAGHWQHAGFNAGHRQQAGFNAGYQQHAGYNAGNQPQAGCFNTGHQQPGGYYNARHQQPADYNARHHLQAGYNAGYHQPAEFQGRTENESGVYASLNFTAMEDTKVLIRPSFTEERLELYFEAKKKFPPEGLSVQTVEIDKTKDEAVVTFDNHTDVKRLLEQHSRIPCTLEGATLSIRLYNAETTVDVPQDNDSCGGVDETQNQRPADIVDSFEDGNEMYVYDIRRGDCEETDTIQVSGFKKETSEDCLSNYFENELRSAGGEIRQNSVDHEQSEAVIVFRDKKVVRRVLSRQHTVEGQVLTVVPLISNPKDLFLSGLSPEISEENLCNFLEAKLKKSPVNVIYNLDRRKAIARFPQNIDFDVIVQACTKEVFGCRLSVSKVSVTSSIIITTLPEHVSHDEVLHYFENTIRSKGGEVTKVDPHLDEGYVVVLFKDVKVVSSVCAKLDHKIRGVTLKVAPFYPSLGLTSDCPPIAVPIPDPFDLSDLDPDIMRLLESNSKWRQKFANELSDECHAEVKWDDLRQIVCTLTEEMTNFRTLAKSWTSKVSDLVTQYHQKFTVKRIPFPDDMLKEVSEEMHSVSVDHPEDMVLITKKDTHELVLVCTTEAAQATAEKLSEAVDKVVKEVKEKREMIEKEETTKPWKAKYLDKKGFRQALMLKNKQLEVFINTEIGVIKFKGPKKQVVDGQGQMEEQLLDLKPVHCNLGRGKARLLLNEATKNKINKHLAEEGFLDLWAVEGDKLILYGDSCTTDFDKMEEIVCKPLETLTFKKDKALKALLNSDKWNAKKDELQAKFEGFIDINTSDSDCLEIFVTADQKQEVSAFFQSFMKKNTVFKEQVSFDGNICRFIKEVLEDSLSAKLADLKKNSTTVTIKDNGTITIEGTAESIKEAKKILDGFKASIVQSKENIRGKGVCHFLKRPVGAECIREVERQTPCVISIKDTGLSKSLVLKQQGDRKMITDTTVYAETKVHGTKVSVVGGDITSFNVEVIISPANKDLKLFGGIAGIVLKKGGKHIEEECKERIKKKGQLKAGQVFVSDSGKLPFKRVIHAVGPVWKGGDAHEDEDLQTTVEKSLGKCDKEKIHSVAIPALSTGMYSYPLDKACHTIVQTVCNYLQKQKTSLKEVTLCDVKVVTVDAFVKALQNECTDVNVLKTLGDDSRPTRAMDSDAGDRGDAATGGGPDRKRPSKSKLRTGPITVEIVRGELIKETTDVIVNSTSSDLRLDIGQSSKALLHAAGDSIQQECKDSYPKGIRPGQVALTSGGNLKCSNVFHVTLKKFESEDDLQNVQNSVMACLREADQRGFTSLAFPTLGTGGQHYPKHQVALKMLQTVSNFSKKTRNTALTSVRIVVFYKDDDTFKAFIDAEKDWSKNDDSDDQRSDTGHLSARRSDKHQRSLKRSHIPHRELKAGRDYVVFEIGGVRVSASQGDITEEETDAIVASCTKDMNLKKGKVTEAILKKGGHKVILEECERHKQDMSSHGIAVTRAGKLKTKHVIYVETKYKTWQWKPVIQSCLREAEKHHLKSIALPLFGTNTGSKADEIVEIMYDALIDFLHTKPSHLHQVKIVIFRKQAEDMMSTVIRTLRSRVEAAKKEHHRLSSTVEDSGGDAEDNMDVCRITVFAADASLVKKATDKLRSRVKDTWQTRHYPDESVSRLTSREKKILKDLADKHHAIIEIDEDKQEVRLTGLTSDILNISDEVNKFFMRHIKTQAGKEQAAQLSNLVAWSYVLKDQKVYPFPQQDNLKIENAFKNNEKQVKVYDRSGAEYIIDLVNREEYSVKNPATKFPVLRRDKIEEKRQNLPKNWESMKPDQNLLLVTLQQSTAEYKKVEDEFTKSLGRTPHVVKIERIQNKTLWSQYSAKKQQIEASQPKRAERILWHGTAQNAVDSINNHGFNRSYCGKNAVAYGEGVYFAVNAAYSDQSKYSQPDGAGLKRIYYARVLTGQYTTGSHGMRVLPARDSATPHILFDSATNSVSNPSMFVIFHDTQAYPDHIITYK